MPRYMLDTDTCSCIMKRSEPLVLKRLQGVPVTDVSMSVVANNTAELERVRGLALENWTVSSRKRR